MAVSAVWRLANSLKLTSELEWRFYCKGELTEKGTMPSDISTNPHITYSKSGWVNAADWLGKEPSAALKCAKPRCEG